MEYLDKDLFYSKVRRIYDTWNNGEDGFANVNSFFLDTGRHYDFYSKSPSFHRWLFRLHLNNVLILFTRERIYILTWYPDAYVFYEPIFNKKWKNGIPPIRMIMSRESDDHASGVKKLFMIMNLIGGNVGIIHTELSTRDFWKTKYPGSKRYYDQWKQCFDSTPLPKIDMSAAFQYSFAVNGSPELKILRTFSRQNVSRWNMAITTLFRTVREKKEVTHFELGQNISFHSCFPDDDYRQEDRSTFTPVHIMRGEDCELDKKHENTKEKVNLKNGTIIIRIPTQANEDCIVSEIIRTILVNPSTELKSYYQIVVETHRKVIEALIPGRKLKDVHKVGMEYIQQTCPGLLKHIIPQFG